MKVPFLDLKAQYELIKDEIQTAIQQVLENTAFAGGPFVAQFEKEFAAFCGCKNVIVGAGNVVTQDVRANTILAGNPAQVLIPNRRSTGAVTLKTIPTHG